MYAYQWTGPESSSRTRLQIMSLLFEAPQHSIWHEMDLTGPCVLLPVMAEVIGSHNGSSGAADAQMLPMGSGNIPEEFTFVEQSLSMNNLSVLPAQDCV